MKKVADEYLDGLSAEERKNFMNEALREHWVILFDFIFSHLQGWQIIISLGTLTGRDHRQNEETDSCEAISNFELLLFFRLGDNRRGTGRE